MKTNADLKLDHLISLMEKVAIPIPAIPAIPQIPAIPSIPAIIHTGDHDLLIQLNTKVQTLTTSVDKLVARDEAYVLKKDQDITNKDREDRLRLLETFKSVLMGAFIISNIIIVPILIWLVIQAISHSK